MSDPLRKTLTETIRRLFDGDDAVYTSNVDAERKTGVRKATFERLRNFDKAGTSVVGIDKIEAIAKALKLAPWQLLLPNVDIKNPPKLEGEGLSQNAQKMLALFTQLDKADQQVIIKIAQSHVEVKKPQTDNKSDAA